MSSDINDGWTDKPGPIRPGKQQVSIKEKTMKGPSEQNEKLKMIGKRFTSPGYDYAGSIAVHIYKSRFGPIEVMTQNCVGPTVMALEANFALQQCSEAVAASYGYKRPGTRLDLMNKDAHYGNKLVLETPTSPATTEEKKNEPSQPTSVDDSTDQYPVS